MSGEQPEGWEVVTTTGDRAQAVRLAREAVRLRLAACAQIDGPVLSVYRWREELEEDQEWRCTLKTTPQRVGALQDWLQAAHSYEQPQIIALPILDGSAGYLQWLRESCGDAPHSPADSP